MVGECARSDWWKESQKFEGSKFLKFNYLNYAPRDISSSPQNICSRNVNSNSRLTDRPSFAAAHAVALASFCQ